MRRWRALAALLALALMVGTVLAPRAGAGNRAPNTSGYQKLLDQYLSVIERKPLTTRFDYIRFYKDTTRAVRMSQQHTALTSVHPATMDRATRTAWAINTYNFLVIESATSFLWHRVFRGWERVRAVAEIRSGQGTFFRRVACYVDSTGYPLDTFERHFLFYDHDKRDNSPPDSLDPRVHFAIVCGAIGCPALQPRVFRADSLDRQLDMAVREALANPAHLKWDPATGVLEASEIFEWFPGDFGGPAGELKFIRRHAPKDIATAIDQGKITGITRYIPWDWKLNQTP